MSTLRIFRLATVAAALLATGGAALAQSAACQSYRAELASMGRGGGGSYGAQRDYAQAAGEYQAMGCDRGFFGAPAACAGISSRMRAAQASYSSGGFSNEGRRQALTAAIAAYCQPGDEQLRRIRSPEEEAERARRARERKAARANSEDKQAIGGSRMVCVRSCDGFFFPVSNAPDGRGGANEMCQALCPGAQTAAYKMPLDGEIQQAVSVSGGRAYSALPAALRYQKGADPSCSCRKDGQSWAQALRGAEAMIDRKKGDIYVTAAKSEELSRPKLTRIARQKSIKIELATETPKPAAAPLTAYTSTSTASPPSAPLDAETTAALKANVPTDGKQSAGIGPQVIEGEKVLAKDAGPKREVEDEAGSKKLVRVIAPDVVPPPQTAAE